MVGFPSDQTSNAGLDEPLEPDSGTSVETSNQVVRHTNPRVSVSGNFSTESLILAQDERWRRASYMQVERTPASGNTGEVLVANG